MLEAEGTTLTAAELAARAERSAAGLAAAGLGPGDTMLLYGVDAVRAVELALAADRLGAAVTASPLRPADEAATRLGGARVAVAVTVVDGEATLRAAGVPYLSPADVARDRGPAPAPTSARDADARLRALVADLTGISRGGDVTVVLPHLHPFTLAVVTALLHAGHRVRLEEAGSAAALSGDASTDVLGTIATVDRLVAAVPADDWVPVRHVVAYTGAGDPSPVRARVRERTGRDALVAVGLGASGLETLDAPAGSLVGGFWSWAAGRPDVTAAVTADGEHVSAGALLDRATALAGALAGAGPAVAPLSDGVDMVTAYLAAARAGTFVVAVPAHATQGELAHVVSQSGAQLVLTRDRLEELVAERREPPPPTAPAGGLLPFTSGTTGAPRMVRPRPTRWSPQLRAAWDAAAAARVGIHGPGRHLVTGQPHQLASLTTAVAALHGGQTLVMLGAWSPLRALEAMARHDVTTAFFVPSMFAGLLALPQSVRSELTPRTLESAVHSTASCPVATKRAIFDWWGPVVYERYGAAEAAGTYVTPGEWLARPGTVGKPFPGVEVAILDTEGATCEPYREGLIYVTDSQFEYGDHSRPHDRRNGLVSLGDVGYLDDEGWLFVVGRATEYVSVGGAKFHPGEIEEVMAAHAAVAECAVVPVPHRVLGQVTVAYLVLRPESAADAAASIRALNAYAREHLPRERRPMRFRVVDELPRTAAGKLARRELAERAAAAEESR